MVGMMIETSSGGRKRPASSYICRLFSDHHHVSSIPPDFDFFVMMKQHAVDMCSSILDFRQAQHQVIKVAQWVLICQPGFSIACLRTAKNPPK